MRNFMYFWTWKLNLSETTGGAIRIGLILMKTVFRYLLTSSAFFTLAAYASDFSIEEKNLQPVSKAMDAAIRNRHEVNADCQFVGKPIDLSGQGHNADLIVTTAHACNWSANAAPVWILHNNQVVFSSSTQTITLKSAKHHHLFDIQSSRSSAGVAMVELWSYSSRQYKKTRSYVFTPDDEKSCNEHTDLCPWRF